MAQSHKASLLHNSQLERTATSLDSTSLLCRRSQPVRTRNSPVEAVKSIDLQCFIPQLAQFFKDVLDKCMLCEGCTKGTQSKYGSLRL